MLTHKILQFRSDANTHDFQQALEKLKKCHVMPFGSHFSLLYKDHGSGTYQSQASRIAKY
uniref:Uncharacterized protein n=1 Tax=Arundo donax TaxID=35708 RepID=A0A0A8YK06_ARUDO